MSALENGYVEVSLFVVQGLICGSLCTKRRVEEKSEEEASARFGKKRVS
jgi:hypothetical protein